MEQVSRVGQRGGAAIGEAKDASATRFRWSAAVIAVLALVILFADAATLGLALGHCQSKPA